MQHFKIILPYTLLVFLLFTQSCSNNNTVIQQDKLSLIISEMYLADQFIDNNPQFRAQADTLQVYSSIFRKYGYTTTDYSNSIKYYIKKGDTYKKINLQAKEILVKKSAELNKKLNIISEEWWATAQIAETPIKDLYKNIYIRSIKWIIVPRDTVIWKINDSIITDVPQNKLWWHNNIILKNNTITIIKHNSTIDDEKFTRNYKMKHKRKDIKERLILKNDK
ncbi:MAG: DUF4296 domain-containing protein [Bacteroidales bacterium]